MNRFNEVFLAIKKQCEKQSRLAEVNSFDAICREAKISPDKLPVYLSYLKDAGLISYSIEDKYIYLTSFGKKQQQLLKE